MGKFNKGDRVKALVNGVDYKAGDEFVLTADGNGTRVYFIDNVGDRRMRPQEEFELLPVAATGTTESQPATLTIESGKFYRTRDGRKVGPMESDSLYWNAPGIQDSYYDTGRQWRSHETQHDLIAEWVDEPVAEGTNDDMLPVAEQQEAARIIISADKFYIGDNLVIQPKSTLLRTKQGYGFEIARHGDYVWVDTGQKAPIVLKAADVQAAA